MFFEGSFKSFDATVRPWSKKEFIALLSTFERFCQAATSNTLVQTDTGGINSTFVSVDLMETGPV